MRIAISTCYRSRWLDGWCTGAEHQDASGEEFFLNVDHALVVDGHHPFPTNSSQSTTSSTQFCKACSSSLRVLESHRIYTARRLKGCIKGHTEDHNQ